jgi:diguanylate cyclase (GGDEF)-like protein
MPDTPDAKERINSLEAALQQRERELTSLRETALAVGSEFDLDKLFTLIAHRARQLIGAQTVLIPILSRDRDEYTYRAAAGESADEIVGESLPRDFGVCGWVLKHRKPWWRGMLSELSPQERNLWEKEAGTLVMVPLVGRKDFLGGISGLNKRGGGEFNQNDLHLLELFAGQAAIAIENAMAMEAVDQSRRAAEEAQSELKRANKRLTAAIQALEQLSLYDPLTGLPNRSLFRDRLRQDISHSAASGRDLILMVIDIDRFQEMNDTLGHEAGDTLLKAAAACFSDLVTAHDGTIARMSGDEFAVLLDVDVDTAIGIAATMRGRLAEPMRLAGQEVVVTAAVGIAVHPRHGHDVSSLFKSADAAMITAKRDRTGVEVFDERRDTGATTRFAMAQDLRKALDGREFSLHYQPKVELANGVIHGVEALARWRQAGGVTVPPDMFISALEHTGLITPFTYWAIEMAVAQRAEWLVLGWDIAIAVNVPLSVVMDARFLPEVSRIVRGNRLEGGLVLEITENIFLGDYDRINGILSELRGFGIGFSIDDFGTGHSSLARLRQLPVGEIKIDRSFVMTMLENQDDEVIVRSTIDLAHNLGLKVVAEGVETAAIMTALTRLDCDIVQGYHISRALPATELTAFLASSVWSVARTTLAAAEA